MIEGLRASANINSEMKWGRVSNYHLATYKKLVDLYFDSPSWMGPVHFHTLCVDTWKRDESAFNDGSKEIGFNKELYQLAMKMWRIYPGHIFHVYPDYRDTPQNPLETRLILNRGAHKKSTRRDWPFRRLHMLQSKHSLPLQLVDVLLGATAFQINDHISAQEASAAKSSLSRHIYERAGITNPMADTGITGKFTIWHRRMKCVPRP